MHTHGSGSHVATAVMLIVWVFVTAGCNEPLTIDRMSITPAAPSGQATKRIDVTSTTPPTPLAPGQQAELSVDVSQQGSDLKVQWLAPQGKGHFARATDGLSTTFVAPNEPGPVEITCQLMSNGKTKIVNLPIQVVGQSPPPADSPAPTAAQRSAAFDIESGGFVPCGWMGDGEEGDKYLKIEDGGGTTPTGASSSKWSFKPGGKKQWLAVGWQFGDCNWGDSKGLDLSNRGFKRITVWAKGVPDSENRFPVIQFKAGGNTALQKKYKASFSVAREPVTLTSQWQPYYLDIQGEDLSSVISAFTVAIRSADHPKGATFYIGGINYNAGN